MPIPSSDFDPTETAIPWAALEDAGIGVIFATPDGRAGRADERLLSGRGFGPWSPLLRADSRARELYDRMSRTDEFRDPIAYEQIEPDHFDGVVLPGGHAPGMKAFLESERLQNHIAECVAAGMPVGAICHGVLCLARARHPETDAPVLEGRRVTALTKSLELSAWTLTCLWLGDYYRTYDETVEAEVRRAVGSDGTFESGPFPLRRDSPEDLDRGFTVRDGSLLTARWPGDAHRFAAELVEMLSG